MAVPPQAGGQGRASSAKRSSVAAFIPVLAALTLAACGFTPLYEGRGGGGIASEIRSVYVDGVAGPPDASYYLAGALRDVLPGEAAGRRYSLSVALTEQRRAVAVTEAANTTRFDYVLRATYRLTDTETEAVRRHQLQTVVSYGVVDSQYASLVGREDAVRRASLDLARRVETDVALYLKGRAPDTAPVPLPPVIDDEPLDEVTDDDFIPDPADVTDAPAGAAVGSRP